MQNDHIVILLMEMVMKVHVSHHAGVRMQQRAISADMLERLGIREVNFDDGAMFLFKSPREGAELLWSIERGEEVATKETKQQYAVDQILNHHLGTYLTPPRFERSINVQEAETILCKWKSYMGGRYKVGEDVESCRESLHKFPRSKTAQQLLKVGRDSLW